MTPRMACAVYFEVVTLAGRPLQTGLRGLIQIVSTSAAHSRLARLLPTVHVPPVVEPVPAGAQQQLDETVLYWCMHVAVQGAGQCVADAGAQAHPERGMTLMTPSHPHLTLMSMTDTFSHPHTHRTCLTLPPAHLA